MISWITSVARTALAQDARAQEHPNHNEHPYPAPNPDADPQSEEGPDSVGADEKNPATVVVHGRAQAVSRGASDFNVRVGELANVPRANASDLLKLAPGILLTNAAGEGHAEQVFLRGFDAREGQDIEFSLGGMPINDAGNLHGNGYADLHFIIPELVESIRVLEGPFDPRQGNYAVAGSAQYELGLDRRGLTGKYSVGNFGSHRTLLLWGPNGANRHTLGGAELYTTDGFGTNRAAKRGTAMMQYEGAIEGGVFRILGTAYGTHFSSAGVLRADDVDRGRVDFFGTNDNRQGGDASRFSMSFDVEKRFSDMLYLGQVFITKRSMRLRENFTGFLLDTQHPEQTPHAQRGDLLDLNVDALTMGLRGAARYKTRWFKLPQEFEVGVLARGDTTDGSQYRSSTALDVPYRRETDLGADLGNVGLYADATVKLLPWLGLRGGVREDIFFYNVLDRCASKSVRSPSPNNPPGDASCLSQSDFGQYREPVGRVSTASSVTLPRGSLIVGPFRGFQMNISAGKGARSIDPNYINQDRAQPFAELAAYEGGVQYAGGIDDISLVARSIFFSTHVDRDLIFSEVAGRNLLSTGTSRSGWVGTLRATGTWFDEQASVTLVRSTFDDTGLLVPYVPDVVVRNDNSVHKDLVSFRGSPVRGSLGTGITYVGRRPLPYGQRSDTIFTLDAQASARWSAFELTVSSSNVFDARYKWSEYNYTSDFRGQAQPTLVPARHFSAGPPRIVMFTFGINLGGT